MDITFADLRRAMLARLPHFKNRKGEAYHKQDTTADPGSEWVPAQWMNAVVGELGELAGLLKNIDRGECTMDEVRDDIGREGADVVLYLDVLMHRCGINLGEWVRRKFNEKSEAIGSPVRLEAIAGPPHGGWLHGPPTEPNTPALVKVREGGWHIIVDRTLIGGVRLHNGSWDVANVEAWLRGPTPVPGAPAASSMLAAARKVVESIKAMRLIMPNRDNGPLELSDEERKQTIAECRALIAAVDGGAPSTFNDVAIVRARIECDVMSVKPYTKRQAHAALDRLLGLTPPRETANESVAIAMLRESERIERDIQEMFRWGCCDKNVDRKPCESSCVKKQMLTALRAWREEQTRAVVAGSAKLSAHPAPVKDCGTPGPICGEPDPLPYCERHQPSDSPYMKR